MFLIMSEKEKDEAFGENEIFDFLQHLTVDLLNHPHIIVKGILGLLREQYMAGIFKHLNNDNVKKLKNVYDISPVAFRLICMEADKRKRKGDLRPLSLLFAHLSDLLFNEKGEKIFISEPLDVWDRSILEEAGIDCSSLNVQ